MITVPTREQLVSDLLAYLHALKPEIAATPDSDIGAQIQMLVDGLFGLHVQVDTVQRDVFPITASTEAPTPPCGACRQLLWEFCGDIEVILANLSRVTGVHRLGDLLPLPFDDRLLR